MPLLAAEQATAGSNGPAAAGKVKGLAHEAPPEPSPDDHVQKGMAWGLVNGELHCYDGEGAMIS